MTVQPSRFQRRSASSAIRRDGALGHRPDNAPASWRCGGTAPPARHRVVAHRADEAADAADIGAARRSARRIPPRRRNPRACTLIRAPRGSAARDRREERHLVARCSTARWVGEFLVHRAADRPAVLERRGMARGCARPARPPAPPPWSPRRAGAQRFLGRAGALAQPGEIQDGRRALWSCHPT